MNANAPVLSPARPFFRKATFAVAAALGLGLLAGVVSPAQAAGGIIAGVGYPELAVIRAQQMLEGSAITVAGTGTVTAEPDVARLSFGVSAEDPEAAVAAEAVNAAAEAMTETLVAAGIDEKDIQTSGLSLYPQYSWNNETGESTVTGYRASVEYTVAGVAVGDIGEILGIALDAGATQVNTIAYYSSDYDAQYQQALVAAVAQAQEKAQTLFGALYSGESETQLVFESVEESRASQQYRYADTSVYSAMATAAGEADTANAKALDASATIQPGTIEIEANVTMTYRAYDFQGIAGAWESMAGMQE